MTGEVQDGDVVAIQDSRGAFLGRGYYNRKSLISIRVLTRSREKIDEAFFRRRLKRAIDYRTGFYPEDTARRIVSSEGDFLPGLIVDQYDDVLTVAINTLGMDRWSELIREILIDEFKPRSLVLRADSSYRTLEGLSTERRVWSGEPDARAEIKMGGLVYVVDPLHGQKTGFFLDQRDNRARLEGRVEGHRVLDAFCYSGAWGLSALSFGAREAVFIDSSEKALEMAEANSAKNQMEGRTEFLKDDAFHGLEVLGRSRERFDTVVLDPPALVKGKSQLAQGLKGYREINRRGMELVSEGGWLFTSSCSHAVGRNEFRSILMQAATEAKRVFRFVEWGMQAKDHPILLSAPETEYLKCAVLRAVG